MTVIEHEVNSPALVPMDFHGDQILTFKAGGEPYVAMRRIVENLSMSWGTQRNKLERQERKFNCVLMNTVGADGKERAMLSMPVRKLALWLACIETSRIKNEEKRAKIELYQEESGQALHDYWTRGVAIRDDMAGMVTEIDPRVMRAFGGVMKGVVIKSLKEVLPAMVAEEVTGARYGLTRDCLTAGQVLDMAKVPQKGRRGLVNKAAASLRRFCESQGEVPRQAFIGNSAKAYVYPVAMANAWLNEYGREMITEWRDGHSEQAVLKLVPKLKDQKSKTERPL
ncbi:MAG: hypothetical protein CMH91_15105 [Oceanicaulis sp.]|uniref:phage antirepressor N-terminal domain-containing protein n=1 Tax=Oceanicaulis sp. TaxID=1924941 RepID=UPI000C618F31|nr:phage antirepressor N-terminal domain-containing protein [Oceanicaulis sp.]MBC40374.1 hypothetical protein [Oceanicaulis sp.]HBU62416.1 hypothetical protein [Oceanicaulis sp.]|tara:strand:+ start:49 stop:897 length:849 start_codon:yes stop_codon:yes gene_type:complete